MPIGFLQDHSVRLFQSDGDELEGGIRLISDCRGVLRKLPLTKRGFQLML